MLSASAEYPRTISTEEHLNGLAVLAKTVIASPLVFIVGRHNHVNVVVGASSRFAPVERFELLSPASPWKATCIGEFFGFDVTEKIISEPRLSQLRTISESVELAAQPEALRQEVRMRDSFLSVATHELKTPVTAIKLVLDMFRRNLERGRQTTKEELLKSVEPVQRQVERLVKLIDNLLDVSRASQGALVLEFEQFDLCSVVDEVCARLRPQAEWTKTRLTTQLLGPVFGTWDRSRMEQVVTNLVSNSIKYGNSKPVEVTVASSDGQAILQVRDQGIGISTIDQQKIFRPYERATQLEKSSSLGLGLFIVKEIVAAHKGKIHIESSLGQGTVFTIELPAEKKNGSES